MEDESKIISDTKLGIVDSLHGVITEVEHAMQQRLGLVCKNLIERYFALFLLTVTMALALVIYSMELIFYQLGLGTKLSLDCFGDWD
jgi:hypothetical protein